MSFDVYKGDNGGIIKAFTKGVVFDTNAQQQVKNVADMPFIFKHVAVMPDVHLGKGATVGSVIATRGAVIPAAVGVDIGCGMCAVKTNIKASDLPESLHALRLRIEELVPVGFGQHNDTDDRLSEYATPAVRSIFKGILKKHPKVDSGQKNTSNEKASMQLGTLGGGNHFIELCLDTEDNLWIMLHSGSRGIGNQIGTYFIDCAREYCAKHYIRLIDNDLAYLVKGDEIFEDYMDAVSWAQWYASANRQAMLTAVFKALKEKFPSVLILDKVVNCHHNYVNNEMHYGEEVIVTRKGAVAAHKGVMGIIPGSMGTKSYIVRGLGNQESFCSCSHGAGRVMSRGEAKKKISLEEHVSATHGVECRKDSGVLDESPAAYKNIDAVMAAQTDLVEIVTTLKQILCIKG